jgi:hypothetical protein
MRDWSGRRRQGAPRRCLPSRVNREARYYEHRWRRFDGDLGERLVRAVVIVLAAAILAGGCSDDKPAASAGKASSEEILKRDCADPKWRDQNLGLWYSVCRQPLRW